jgi:site-specific recombinase XerD
VESHLRVHLVPFFGDRSIDRIDDGQVSRLPVRLRRSGAGSEDHPNIVSTLHSVFELARRRRWVDTNPCTLIDLPAGKPNTDIRFMTYDELDAVLQRGIPNDARGRLDRALYLIAAMTGL